MNKPTKERVMLNRLVTYLKKKILFLILIGFILGILITVYSHKAIEATSTNEFCETCHVHPHVFDSWKLSKHHDTESGIHVGCVECHLPPNGHGYLKEKARLGLKDVYGFLFKDSADFNWEAKSTLEQAQHFVFKESCINCHENLFPLTLTKEGQDAHLYYTQNEDELRCINCHLHVGHFDPNALHAKNVDFGNTRNKNIEVFTETTKVENHIDFIETIPNTTVSFKMIAIPEGSFKMGSPEDEQMRKKDEGPVKKINISPFFIAEVEVTWDEFLAFYSATAGEGRSTDTEGSRTKLETDAISGPTPPYGQPDQNWGLGKRPAITMSYYAAKTYCKWLSQVSGKTYRLPTEAEWEYACRGGRETTYFIDGNPKDFGTKGFWGNLFGKENNLLNDYVVFSSNSNAKTQEPENITANPFGVKNMLGNAAEYCSDWYAPDSYSKITDGSKNPTGPANGKEHVIRGGSFKSNIGSVRCASRDYTKTEAWLKTDPQIPKSKWWLSDCNYISFRVVCEFDENTGKN